jgi:hypothetical protein
LCRSRCPIASLPVGRISGVSFGGDGGVVDVVWDGDVVREIVLICRMAFGEMGRLDVMTFRYEQVRMGYEVRSQVNELVSYVGKSTSITSKSRGYTN